MKNDEKWWKMMKNDEKCGFFQWFKMRTSLLGPKWVWLHGDFTLTTYGPGSHTLRCGYGCGNRANLLVPTTLWMHLKAEVRCASGGNPDCFRVPQNHEIIYCSSQLAKTKWLRHVRQEKLSSQARILKFAKTEDAQTKAKNYIQQEHKKLKQQIGSKTAQTNYNSGFRIYSSGFGNWTSLD